MRSRSLLVAALLAMFAMQPLTNSASAASSKTAKPADARKKAVARPAPARAAPAKAAPAKAAPAKAAAPARGAAAKPAPVRATPARASQARAATAVKAPATRVQSSRTKAGAKAAPARVGQRNAQNTRNARNARVATAPRTQAPARAVGLASRAPSAPTMNVSLRKSAPLALAAPAAAAAAAGAAAASDVEITLDENGMPALGSSAFYVVNATSGEVLLERNSAAVLPIASITKLMTAMVVLDGGQELSELLSISQGDIDLLKGTGSRLGVGTLLTRGEMLHLALMSSENRAASALARYYPGGERAFVEAMNVKARLLGLWNTRFHDSTGLNPRNVSSPRDLAKMVSASASYPLIRQFSTSPEYHVEDVRGRTLRFGNTNGLVNSPEWAISVSKTGYISEAGRCLVLHTWLNKQPVVMVLMDSSGRYTRTADAQRVRKWLEHAATQRIAAAPARIEG